MDVKERAARYIDRMGGAVSGAGGHNHTLGVARALVCDFCLPDSVALDLMLQWNVKFNSEKDKWGDGDLRHKIKSAHQWVGPRGRKLQDDDDRALRDVARVETRNWTKQEKAAYDAGRLAKFVGGAPDVDLPFLANRSEIDPATIDDPKDFLRQLFLVDGSERVLVFGSMYDKKPLVFPVELAIPRGGSNGVLFLIQPVDGVTRHVPRIVSEKNPSGMSMRTAESVITFRYMLIESDEAPHGLWLSALVRLIPRVVAIVFSGGKSCHALVRVDARTKGEYDEIKRRMVAGLTVLGADPQAMSWNKMMRMPCCLRDGKEQKLLYFAPSAPDAPIASLLARRDVFKVWADEAVRAAYPKEINEESRKALNRALRGCEYYAKFDSVLKNTVPELRGVMKIFEENKK